MVLHIGRIYRGAQFSNDDAKAVINAAGFMIAIESLTFFPGFGWVIKSGIAASVIKTLGEAIIKIL